MSLVKALYGVCITDTDIPDGAVFAATLDRKDCFVIGDNVTGHTTEKDCLNKVLENLNKYIDKLKSEAMKAQALVDEHVALYNAIEYKVIND